MIRKSQFNDCLLHSFFSSSQSTSSIVIFPWRLFVFLHHWFYQCLFVFHLLCPILCLLRLLFSFLNCFCFILGQKLPNKNPKANLHPSLSWQSSNVRYPGFKIWYIHRDISSLETLYTSELINYPYIHIVQFKYDISVITDISNSDD